MSHLSRLIHTQWHRLIPPVSLRYVQGLQHKQKELCMSPAEAQLTAARDDCCSNGAAANKEVPPRVASSPSLPSMLSVAPHPPPSSYTTSSSSVLCSLMDLLSVEDRAVRLPCAVPSAPVETPHTVEILPQELPQHSTAVTSIVEPYDDLLPRVLPNADHQHNVTMECINMLRVRRLKMKKHKKKKEYKRNRVSIEHNRLLRKMEFEKAFMNEQLTVLQAAESFNAEEYVQQQLDRKNYIPVPHYFGGQCLPAVCVMELMLKKNYTIPGTEDNSNYSYDYGQWKDEEE